MKLKLGVILVSLLQAKRKSLTANEERKDHIVLGTLQGSLLLLNYDTLEVENKLVYCVFHFSTVINRTSYDSFIDICLQSFY